LGGAITRVSADSFKDEHSGASFYTATIAVPPAQIAALEKRDGARQALRSGLPVQVLVPLRRRTLLQYLLEPIDQAVWRGMREH
jgi:HlyD family secretion protein